METARVACGAEEDRRIGRHAAWKKLSLRWKTPLAWVGPALVLVVAAKIFLGGIYLRAEGFSPGPDVALAQEKKKVAPPAEKETPERVSAQSLKEKELALRNREQELMKREEELIPLKRDIDEKLNELNELQTKLTTYAKTLADREEAMKETKMAHLVELYTAMEPSKAAAIMEKLKMETVVLILRNMKGKSAGQIIALMKPEMGAQVVEKLSQSK
jgi:flagellar motility protein MotE (MotC chaperone)